jgi:GTP cyclohydrolase II
MTPDTSPLEALVERDQTHDCAGFGPARTCVRVVAVADLPSRFGDFKIVAFWNNRDAKEHIAGPRRGLRSQATCRSACTRSASPATRMGSLRCDCRDQLEAALTTFGTMERGILLYLRQEGRGIGLINKIRAYALQDRGLDTVEANLALGFRDDERDYGVAAHMLRSLDLRSIQLMTNNPNKLRGLEQHGVVVSGRIPHQLPATRHNRFYLETKAARSGHYLDFTGEPEGTKD